MSEREGYGNTGLLKKQEYQINNLTSHLKELEKRTIPQTSKRKENEGNIKD